MEGEGGTSGGPGARRERTVALAAVIVAVCGFSWGFILVKLIGFPPPVLAFWRLFIGAAALHAAARIAGIRYPRLTGATVVAGLAFGAHQLLFIAATQNTSVAIVTLIAAVQPLVVAVLSRRVVGERVDPWLFGCAALAVSGVAVVVYANIDAASRSLTGDVLAVVNLFAFTAYFLAAKRARTGGAHTVTFTATVLWVALAVVAPVAALVGLAVPDGRQLGLLLLLALGSGNGHLLVNWAHPRISAALSSLVLAAVPLLASVWAHLVLGEPYGWRHLLGMLLVVAAIETGRRIEARREVVALRESPGAREGQFGPASQPGRRKAGGRR